MTSQTPNSKSVLFTFHALVLCLFCLACQPAKEQTSYTPLPSEGCKAAWADSAAFQFVDQLEAATRDGHPVWPGYSLGDGAVVLHAGKASDSTECLGLWQEGKAKGFIKLEELPKLATMLYGYYLNFDGIKQEEEENVLLGISDQPQPLTDWLEGHGVKSAVLMPVDFPNFPFEIPALKKMQVAIHESFHIEVMIRYWFTGRGNWPAWDEQPDRPGLQNCYHTSEELKAAFQKEKTELINLIEALLDQNKERSREAGLNFLDLRKARYLMLEGVTVDRQDGSKCNCEEAENLMELEEGLADYGSWTMLYNLGISSREELIQRYGAIQNDPFYLTGAMLMHAIALMYPGDTMEVINEINQSATVQEGALITLFEREFQQYHGLE